MAVVRDLPPQLAKDEYRELLRLIICDELERNNDKLSRCTSLLIRAQVDAIARPNEHTKVRLEMALRLIEDLQLPKVFERIMKERKEAVETLLPQLPQRRR